MKYDLQWLKDEPQSQFLYFFGHKPHPQGLIEETCFSQWWEGHPFEVEGITYLTAEHYMMAGKARLFGDEEALAAILATKHPGNAKTWGRKVQHFEPAIWEEHRSQIVFEGNLAKFGQHPELKAYILSTAPAVLVEASPYDRIWGIGLLESQAKQQGLAGWQGLNLLGFALMEVRDALAAS